MLAVWRGANWRQHTQTTISIRIEHLHFKLNRYSIELYHYIIII